MLNIHAMIKARILSIKVKRMNFLLYIFSNRLNIFGGFHFDEAVKEVADTLNENKGSLITNRFPSFKTCVYNCKSTT